MKSKPLKEEFSENGFLKMIKELESPINLYTGDVSALWIILNADKEFPTNMGNTQ
jgi:hypothetical protein